MTVSLPDHLSYSAGTTFKSCPRAFYLSRIKRAEAAQAWYFVVGSAVHAWIEQYLKNDKHLGGVIPIDEQFNYGVLKARKVEPDTTKWLFATVNDVPIIEERALKLAFDCVEYAAEWLEDFTAWQVEPDISGFLPGCTMQIKAFPDLIGEHSKHGPLIVDWKTGKTRGQRLQLETYNCLMQVRSTEPDMLTGYRGMFVYLNPEAQKSRPTNLTMTPADLGKMYGDYEKKIKAGAFPAMPQFMCDFCTMLPNCKTKSGANPRTLYYDTPNEDGVIPF